MITGYVNQALEPVVPVAVLDRNGHRWRLEVVVDTGFSGDLTLPLASINELGLPWRGSMEMFQADGRAVKCHRYAATIIWDGQHRTIEVMESATESLLGTNLLNGYLLTIQMTAGGEVSIAELPAPPE